MPENHVEMPDITMAGRGEFTPPIAPCSNVKCGYVELECVHHRSCVLAETFIETQPDQGITHRWKPRFWQRG